MSMRFEKLMAEHRYNATTADMTDSEGIILGMTPLSRSLIRAHLDHNKWEESGSLLALQK